MRRIAKIIPCLLLILLLSCTRAQKANTSARGRIDSPTVAGSSIAPPQKTIDVGATPSMTSQVNERGSKVGTPVAMTIDPTYFNFATNTPTPTLDPDLFLLRILSPGPMSKVVSPIDLIVHVAPYYTGATHIELIGEDGVELYRKIFKTYSNIGYFTRIDEKIEFEIRGAAEVARLQISTFDSNGRMQALNSVRLLLQAVGENEFAPPFDTKDRLILRFPKEGDEIKGGSLQVTGEFQPANNLPVILELIDLDGKVIGSRLLQLNPAEEKYQQFTTSIPYKVTKKTAVRLVIRQSDDRIDGLAYLFSERVTIVP
jgi:hypothetical protein